MPCTRSTLRTTPAAAAVLCAGGCLVLDPGDSAPLSGKAYSSNYAKFYGYGTGYEPVLTFSGNYFSWSWPNPSYKSTVYILWGVYNP